jgi:hypothetical protein
VRRKRSIFLVVDADLARIRTSPLPFTVQDDDRSVKVGERDAAVSVDKLASKMTKPDVVPGASRLASPGDGAGPAAAATEKIPDTLWLNPSFRTMTHLNVCVAVQITTLSSII